MLAANEWGALTRVLVMHARDAFVDARTVDAEWRDLNFTAPPDLSAAAAESDAFLALLGSTGAELVSLPRGAGLTLDALYVRDAAVVAPGGVILCRMGKPRRGGEPAAQARAYRRLGVPILGEIREPGLLEGGDVVWLDARTVAVGRGYRTNDEGIRQLGAILGDTVDEVVTVPLPHWRGPGDVFHLMSILSPVDDNLAVVYAPLLPVPFRERLVARGMQFVDVPDSEFDAMGANVLAVAPRRCIVLAGSPRTRAALEDAGVDVLVYSGREISLKGGGGPTCLTRPIGRRAPRSPTEARGR
jgi:N-dimethylarginine dimethylaminohydrolase